MILETKRLILRPITHADFDSWAEILTDPETMRFYASPYDRSGVQRWIDWTLSNYSRYGFGLWALILKETGEFIGDCGITMQNIHGQMLPEVGYHLNKRFHRQGYGSEAAAACVRWGFENRDFPALYSYMTSPNIPSRRTAMKCGMQFVEEYLDEVHELTSVYRITREAWQQTLSDNAD